VALLVERVKARDPKAPAVVTGDFNAGETNPAAQAMLAAFKDSFRILHPDAREVGTFNGFKYGQAGGERSTSSSSSPGPRSSQRKSCGAPAIGRYPSGHFTRDCADPAAVTRPRRRPGPRWRRGLLSAAPRPGGTEGARSGSSRSGRPSYNLDQSSMMPKGLSRTAGACLAVFAAIALAPGSAAASRPPRARAWARARTSRCN